MTSIMHADCVKFLKFLLSALLKILLVSPCLFAATEACAGDDLEVGGYLQVSALGASVDMPEPIGSDHWKELRLQHRLNLRWHATPELSFHWQMRTRLFAGKFVRKLPGYAETLTRDEGLINLSWTVIDEGDFLLHYIPDRLYVESDRSDWNVRVGRQRINWGVNMITNPNDIFNIYSIYDFDYPERPGTDALRVQRFMGFGSRIELAASPARDLKDSVAAALYSFDLRGYDLQLIGGYYRERFAGGAGWAGGLGGAGIKGEAMFFSDLKSKQESRRANFILAGSVEYMFANNLFLTGELLYNRQGGQDRFHPTGAELSPDNPSFSRYQAAVQLAYLIHPLLDGSLTTIYYPDQKAVFVSPSLIWSAGKNLDLTVLGQLFLAGQDSVFESAGNLVTVALKYNF